MLNLIKMIDNLHESSTKLGGEQNNIQELNDNFGKSTFSQYDNLRVVIRVRPPLPRELDEGNNSFLSSAIVDKDNKFLQIIEYLGAETDELGRLKDWTENQMLFQFHEFTFDHVYDMDSTQKDVYDLTAKEMVNSVLEGYNSTIFAYGQTGTGKTYTMEGTKLSSHDEKRGIIPRTIDDIFNYIQSCSNSSTKFMVRASYLQIYNEVVADLLRPERTNLQIREDKKRGVFVEVLYY